MSELRLFGYLMGAWQEQSLARPEFIYKARVGYYAEDQPKRVRFVYGMGKTENDAVVSALTNAGQRGIIILDDIVDDDGGDKDEQL